MFYLGTGAPETTCLAMQQGCSQGNLPTMKCRERNITNIKINQVEKIILANFLLFQLT